MHPHALARSLFRASFSSAQHFQHTHSSSNTRSPALCLATGRRCKREHNISCIFHVDGAIRPGCRTGACVFHVDGAIQPGCRTGARQRSRTRHGSWEIRVITSGCDRSRSAVNLISRCESLQRPSPNHSHSTARPVCIVTFCVTTYHVLARLFSRRATACCPTARRALTSPACKRTLFCNGTSRVYSPAALLHAARRALTSPAY
jgi:hypothetical protein